jgi:hypothetical protein
VIISAGSVVRQIDHRNGIERLVAADRRRLVPFSHLRGHFFTAKQTSQQCLLPAINSDREIVIGIVSAEPATDGFGTDLEPDR